MTTIDKIRAEIERQRKFITLEADEKDVDLDADIQMEWDSFNKHIAEYEGEKFEVVWLSRNEFEEVAKTFYKYGKKGRSRVDV